jgi:hypothetical protein
MAGSRAAMAGNIHRFSRAEASADGLTAASVARCDFCQVALHGRDTRVAHFEQPVFAWK